MPSHEQDPKGICSFCMAEVGRENVKTCSVCRLVRYCSRKCQKDAWKTHKKSCTSALRESLANNPEQDTLNSHLSRWINHWRTTLHEWSIRALDLANHGSDRLSTHCFTIQIERRQRPPSQAQFFRMIGGTIMTRDEVVEVLHELQIGQQSIDEWVNDRRGENTVQIVIICEAFLRFLWFSIRDLEPLRKNKEFGRAIADDWDEKLMEIIEAGDPSQSRLHLMRAAMMVIGPPV